MKVDTLPTLVFALSKTDSVAFKIYATQSLSEMTIEDTEYLNSKYMQSFKNWMSQEYSEYYNLLVSRGEFEDSFNCEIMLTNRRNGIKLLAEYIASDSTRYTSFIKEFDKILKPVWSEKYGEDGLRNELNYLKKCFVTFWNIQ